MTKQSGYATKQTGYFWTKQLGLNSYIGILAENVIFNAETKIPLSKEELRKIDWYGENAGQHREQWIYKDIYEIHGTEKTEAVAVQINDRYYIAKRQ